MREFDSSPIPADLLDHLVLDACELENVTERLIRSLTSVDLETIPRGPLAVHLMDVLSRMKDASAALHCVSGRRIKRVADTLSPDSSDDRRSNGPERVRMLADG